MNRINISDWSKSDVFIRTIEEDTPDDLFISCFSYEPRTSGALKKLDTNYKAKVGIFVINEEFKNIIFKMQEVASFANSISFFGKSVDIESSIYNPIKLIMEVDKIIREDFSKEERINITLDITTFPRGELLTIIYYLRHHSKVNCIRILYVSPIKYGEWLTEGYRYTSTPSFFEGPTTFEKKNCSYYINRI
jgi:hypothetical protein